MLLLKVVKVMAVGTARADQWGEDIRLALEQQLEEVKKSLFGAHERRGGGRRTAQATTLARGALCERRGEPVKTKRRKKEPEGWCLGRGRARRS